MQEKYGYGCMSEFRNGFSFVREQPVQNLPIGYSTEESHTIFIDYPRPNVKEDAERIAEESRHGYKFIDEAGNVIIDNLDAYVAVYRLDPPGGAGYATHFYPSYFTEFGTAVVRRSGQLGLINTSGEVLCDFFYDKISIHNPNVAIIKKIMLISFTI